MPEIAINVELEDGRRVRIEHSAPTTFSTLTDDAVALLDRVRDEAEAWIRAPKREHSDDEAPAVAQ